MSASAPIAWQKSSFSGGEGENCVEVALRGGNVMMRESDEPDSTISTTRTKMAAFIARVKNGEFDNSGN
ncbi:DUF397 domain-containing protein [Streptomyces sp. NPDC007100]|uniref:DUF397 domain-containing protein n=1 Tax=Streptomyces sp. NPDC007100 TaxID=3155602 RepID=UPI0033DB05E9